MLTPEVFLGAGTVLLALLFLSGFLLLRDLKRESQIARRVRMIHGQAGASPAFTDLAALRAAATRTVAAIGQTLLRSGLISHRTRMELEKTLANTSLLGQQGVGVFVGCKIILLTGLPLLAWLLTRHLDISVYLRTLAPAGAAVVGLVLPDWLVHRYRRVYLDRLEQGLPDALDMMVICAQAGLGLGPTVIRVAEELGVAYREIAYEFALTANELQIMTDSRVALANMGLRTELDSCKRLAATLIQTIQYGTPLSEALRALSGELRHELLTRYETKAARLPVLLTLPTIVFILPCVFLIAGGPAIIQVMKMFEP